jgi:hypothetical protein
MKLNKLPLILLTVCFLSCKETDDKLFWISENDGQKSDFLFLAESTNVPILKGDSLKIFLTPEEVKSTTTDSTTFKHFGKIFDGQKFKVHVLLLSMETVGRFYCFVIRTYDNEYKIIDDFELAAWAESEKQYCFGSINKDLIIERKCNYKATSDIMQITDEGKIVMTSFHRRETSNRGLRQLQTITVGARATTKAICNCGE